PALLLFVTEEWPDRKPFQRLLELAFMGCDHPRQGGRQFRPQSHLALAFIGKMKELVDDFRAALLPIKLGRFQDRSLPFEKTVAPRDFAPARENVIPPRAIVRQKITEPGQTLDNAHSHLL